MKLRNLVRTVFIMTVSAAVILPVFDAGVFGAETVREALYLGVENYGRQETNKDNKDYFRYRFDVDGTERVFLIDNGTKDAEGEYDYPIQNSLKEGSRYNLTLDRDTVTGAEEISPEPVNYIPPVCGTPGVKTLENFLKTALMPVGTALYIYGGGWNWQDTGASVQARSLGIADEWVRFFAEQDENYTYKGKDGGEVTDPSQSYYPFGGYNEYYYAGLDCSGYVGWVLYNTFETENGKKGYVGAASGFSKDLAEKGWGTWIREVTAPDGTEETIMKPGDLMSMKGHVWISLGTCPDGSVLIVHSTPSESRTGQPGGGVQIGAVGADKTCEAYLLADRIMSSRYPVWYGRYNTTLKETEVYFLSDGNDTGRFSWDTEEDGEGLTDPEGIQEMNAREVLEILFP